MKRIQLNIQDKLQADILLYNILYNIVYYIKKFYFEICYCDIVFG